MRSVYVVWYDPEQAGALAVIVPTGYLFTYYLHYPFKALIQKMSDVIFGACNLLSRLHEMQV